MNSPQAAALGPDGSIWALATPLSRDPTATYHLGDSEPEQSDSLQSPFQLLFRIDSENGTVRSITRFDSRWGGTALVVDSSGSPWMAAYQLPGGKIPLSEDAWNPFYGTAALVRFSPNGDRLAYSTYLGPDAAAAIAKDSQDNIYVGGTSLWKVSNRGALLWSTAIPPGGILTMAAGKDDGVFIGGCTMNATQRFYTSEAAFQTESEGWSDVEPRFPPRYPRLCIDGFVTRFQSDGRLIYSTLLSGALEDRITGLVALDDGSALVSGEMPRLSKKSRNLYLNEGRNILAKLSPDGSNAAYLTPALLGAIGAYPAPVLDRKGMVLFARYESRSTSTGSGAPLSQGISLYSVREFEDSSEEIRVDQVLVHGGIGDGVALDISGTGLDERTEVQLDGSPLEIEFATGTRMLTKAFPIPPPSSAAYLFQEGYSATYSLVVRRSVEDLKTLPTLVVLPFRDH